MMKQKMKMAGICLGILLLVGSCPSVADGLEWYTLRLITEARGVLARPVAVSGNGRFVLLGDYQQDALAVLDAKNLNLLKSIPFAKSGGRSSQHGITAIYDIPARESFFVLPSGVPEIWEVSYASPPPIGFGEPWVHDYRPEASDASQELLPMRRYPLKSAWRDFAFSTDYVLVVGVTLTGEQEVLDLDLKRVVATPSELPETIRGQQHTVALAGCFTSPSFLTWGQLVFHCQYPATLQ